MTHFSPGFTYSCWVQAIAVKWKSTSRDFHRYLAVSFLRLFKDKSLHVVSRGQRRFNWFSFSFRLLLGPQCLSMGTANWASPVATWKSRQTWHGRHVCWSTGTTPDKRFTTTARLWIASSGTSVLCFPASPSGVQIYPKTDQDQGDANNTISRKWFLSPCSCKDPVMYWSFGCLRISKYYKKAQMFNLNFS